jgi:hypothetical protein
MFVRHLRVYLLLVLVTMSSHGGTAAATTVTSGAVAASARPPKLYAGGVAGIADLLDASHSKRFRAMGGGLYLHNSGWAHLSDRQRREVLQIFRGAPVAIELGFGPDAPEAWGTALDEEYLNLGIKPSFVAVNAFADNYHPTRRQWREYSAILRQHGAPLKTLILPNFEYQNFGDNLIALNRHEVSRSPEFQEMIGESGGIVLDTPPAYAFGREPEYRHWVVDAIRWTARRRMTSVVILSPDESGMQWGADTDRYVRYLAGHAAMPTAFVCENYDNEAPAGYPNTVGDDRLRNTAIGNCLALKEQILPSLR